MHILKFLAAGAATLAVAAPAAAQFHPYQPPQQTYPQYQYPQQAQPYYQYPQGQVHPGYQQGYAQPYGGQNVVGQIINQLLGNNYQANDRMAVTQCASAAMTRAAAQYQPRHQQQRYGHPVYNPAANIRVTAITDVRRQRQGLRVSGLMSSGMQAGWPPHGQAHGYHNQVRADLSFTCNVARNGQVTNVRVSRAGHQRR